MWKDIQGFEGKYQVSDLGEVRSLDRLCKHPKGGLAKKKGIIMRQNFKGLYKYVQLGKYGKNMLVHRLVASSFLGLDLNDTKILACHKNDIRDDNRLENLFVGTHTDNMQDASKKGRLKKK